MYYFGRIIGAFFNQLFRFLFWNKFGQKILIAIIIGLIAFWCLGMTKVHAVEEVSDINYEVQSYYDGLFNEFILRFDYALKNNFSNAVLMRDLIINNELQPYVYAGQVVGASYENSRPINNSNIFIFLMRPGAERTITNRNTDYLGVTGYSMIDFTFTYNQYLFQFYSGGVSYTNPNRVIMPYFPLTYTPNNWVTYVTSLRNNDTETITQLLEDIKAEQQATNDFLSEEIDETGISVQAPAVTDTASENMSNNLHNQINTLTTQLQSTVNNYYEGWDAYVWTIPLPQYIGGNISFDSGVTRRIIGSNGVVFNVIQAIWVILFGGYIVGFIKRMLDWIQTGKIFDEGGLADFIWWMDTNNEIIKASMM